LIVQASEKNDVNADPMKTAQQQPVAPAMAQV
jgi:hypothetical protein